MMKDPNRDLVKVAYYSFEEVKEGDLKLYFFCKMVQSVFSFLSYLCIYYFFIYYNLWLNSQRIICSVICDTFLNRREYTSDNVSPPQRNESCQLFCLFVPQNIQWFYVNDLPSHKKDTVSRENLGLNPNAFFMVMPFVK